MSRQFKFMVAMNGLFCLVIFGLVAYILATRPVQRDGTNAHPSGGDSPVQTNRTDTRKLNAGHPNRIAEQFRHAMRASHPASSDQLDDPESAMDEHTDLDRGTDPDLPDGSRRFVSFDSPSPNVTITQDETGAVAVFNTDPSLTHQLVYVPATTASGEITEVPIVIPPVVDPAL